MKTLEQQLDEKEQELRELRKTAVGASLTQELRESGLPDAAQARLRKKFQAAGKVDGIKEAIVEEREYVRKVRAAAGRQHKGSEASVVVDLAESYRLLGLSEDESRIAAGVESAVEYVRIQAEDRQPNPSWLPCEKL